jgi:hypothetical protein
MSLPVAVATRNTVLVKPLERIRTSTTCDAATRPWPTTKEATDEGDSRFILMPLLAQFGNMTIGHLNLCES